MSEFPTLLEAQLMLSEFFTEYGEPRKEKDEPFPSTPVGFQLFWPTCLHVPLTDRNSVFPIFACCCCKWPSAAGACCCMSSDPSNPPWISQVRTKGCFRSSVALGLSVDSLWGHLRRKSLPWWERCSGMGGCDFVLPMWNNAARVNQQPPMHQLAVLSTGWAAFFHSFGVRWGSSQSISFCCWSLFFFSFFGGFGPFFFLDLTSHITTLLTFLPS